MNNPMKFIDPDGRQIRPSTAGTGFLARSLKSIAAAFESKKTYNGSTGSLHLSRAATREFWGVDNTASGIGGALAVSLLQHNELNLTGSVVSKMQSDPAMIQAEQGFISKMKADEGFSKDGVFNQMLNVQFGGNRGDGNGNWTLKGAAGAAANQLTWLVRNADVKATAVRDKNGKTTIKYTLSPDEKLDLRPNGSESAYDVITLGLGFIYHDLWGGNDKLRTKATWNTIISDKENEK